MSAEQPLSISLNTVADLRIRKLIACCVVVVAAEWAAPARAEQQIIGPAEDKVYRSVGSDGVVEFNNFGMGEVIRVAPLPKSDASTAAAARQRLDDILRVAGELAAQRQDREASRRLLAQDQLAVRERAAAIARSQAATHDRGRSFGFYQQPFYSSFGVGRLARSRDFIPGFAPRDQRPYPARTRSARDLPRGGRQVPNRGRSRGAGRKRSASFGR